MTTACDHATLDDLLARYHHWCKGYSPVQVSGADPAFRKAKSSRGYQTIDEIVEDEIEGDIMAAMDFQIGELPDEPPARAYRSAVLASARNCYTGRNVWLSPRLPSDPLERGIIVAEARNLLTRRLIACGVIQVAMA